MARFKVTQADAAVADSDVIMSLSHRENSDINMSLSGWGEAKGPRQGGAMGGKVKPRKAGGAGAV